MPDFLNIIVFFEHIDEFFHLHNHIRVGNFGGGLRNVLNLGRKELISLLGYRIIEIDTWEAEIIHDKMIELAGKMEVKNGIVLWPMRVALSGKAFTPGGGIEIATLLGKEETIERIKKGIEKLS